MWRINEQLINIYTNGAWSRKISLLHMHNCLLQILVNNLKGYKSNSCTFLSDCPRGKQILSFCLILEEAEAQFPVCIIKNACLQTLASLLCNYNLPLRRTCLNIELSRYIYDYHMMLKTVLLLKSHSSK